MKDDHGLPEQAKPKRPGVKTRGPWNLTKIKARCCVDGDCWLWRLALNAGCPVMGLKPGKTMPVRRWLVQRETGEQLSRSVVVRASCGQPTCVSPAHLVVVPRSQLMTERWTPLERAKQAERSREMAARGVGPCRTKYPQELIDQVRSDPCSSAEAAKKYGVPYSYVHKLRQGLHRPGAPRPVVGSSVFTLGFAA